MNTFLVNYICDALKALSSFLSGPTIFIFILFHCFSFHCCFVSRHKLLFFSAFFRFLWLLLAKLYFVPFHLLYMIFCYYAYKTKQTFLHSIQFLLDLCQRHYCFEIRKENLHISLCRQNCASQLVFILCREKQRGKSSSKSVKNEDFLLSGCTV